MLFGKIDYINLLPFHMYLKKSNLTNAIKKSCEFKKSYPANINKKFARRLVDGAFISSIESTRKYIKVLPLGIVAQKKVMSVLVKKNTQNSSDPHSATSNVLAKVLGRQGEVCIGDEALRRFIQAPDLYFDLAQIWYEKYHLPFVFALLCTNKNYKIYKRLSEDFNKNSTKIPQYQLQKYADERKIPASKIKEYLKLISYSIGQKERKSLRLFLKKAKQLKSQKGS